MTTQLTQQPQAGTRVEQVTGVGGEAGTILLGTGLRIIKNEWKGRREKQRRRKAHSRPSKHLQVRLACILQSTPTITMLVCELLSFSPFTHEREASVLSSA